MSVLSEHTKIQIMRKLSTAVLILCFYVTASSQNLVSVISDPHKKISNFYTDFSGLKIPAFNAAKASTMFGLETSSALSVIDKETDNFGFVNYRMVQTYQTLPIENSMYLLHVKNNQLISGSGYIITHFGDLPVFTKASITKKTAIQLAMNYSGAEQFMWQIPEVENELKESKKEPSASYYPNEVALVWYNSGQQIIPEKLRVAYKIDIYSAKPFDRAYYFIDAGNGTLLGKKQRLHTTDTVGTGNTLYCDIREIHSDKVGKNSYRLHDYSRGGGVVTVSGGLNNYGKNFMNNSPDWDLNLPARNAMDAHWGVAQTYDFYFKNFKRNSYDNKGTQLKSYVNYFLWSILTNASWDGNSMQYGQIFPSNRGLTAIDVTGHELTHGVTQSTSNLNYNGETGGMNEAMSDIFGKCVQFYSRPDDISWLIGNEMNYVIRDMSNPNVYQQPDTYNGKYWSSNADVHVLSGVGNYFFYLLCNGGNGINDLGNAYKVKSLGIPKAAAILYRTNTAYLTPTSSYADWRIASVKSAADIYGRNSREVEQVLNAWYAVGVGEKPAALTQIYLGQDEKLSTVSVFPNPANTSQVNINFNLATPGNTVMKLTDGLGFQFQQLNLGFKNTGAYVQIIRSLQNLKNGTYYISLEQEGIQKATTRLIIAK